MAQENRVIIRATPTITPNILEYRDFESSLSEADQRKLFDGESSTYKQRKGLNEPIIMIGNVKLQTSKLKALHIRQEEFIPTISLTFVDNGYIFTSRGYPLTNIIVGVFIQSTVKKLKSVAGDYMITSVSSLPIPGTDSIVYTLSGELYVPKLYGSYSKAYRNMGSMQALQKVAEELQLGFADNQNEGTNDSMTWIIPNHTYKEFIAQIIKFAYKDDNCFFDCFIDRYYILNFINVEKQFARDEEIDTGYVAHSQTALDKDRANPENETDDATEIPIILSNYPNLKGSEFYISEFGLTSNHGDILRNNAIRKYIYWYEHGAGFNEEKDPIVGPGKLHEDQHFRLHYLEPLTSTVTNDGKLPQTVELEDYVDNTDNPESGPNVCSGVWLGTDYGNAHASYKFAQILNDHNWLETEKNVLNVTLDGISANVLRGSRVKVEIYLDKLSATLTNTIANTENGEAGLNQIETGIPQIDDKVQGMIRDASLSDFYYVKSVSYGYINGEFYTDLSLARRHWLLPHAKNEIIG